MLIRETEMLMHTTEKTAHDAIRYPLNGHGRRQGRRDKVEYTRLVFFFAGV